MYYYSYSKGKYTLIHFIHFNNSCLNETWEKVVTNLLDVFVHNNFILSLCKLSGPSHASRFIYRSTQSKPLAERPTNKSTKQTIHSHLSFRLVDTFSSTLSAVDTPATGFPPLSGDTDL